MFPSLLLKEIQSIKSKHKRDGYVTIIYFDDFPKIEKYRLDYIPSLLNRKKYTSFQNKDEESLIQIQKRKMWRDQKKKYRSNNKEESRRKAREYYHKNKDRLLQQIYAARKKRLNK